MKVVEYGVRDVSDTMEGKIIIFSKWIPSWMLLICGRVDYIRYVWAYV